MTLVEAQFPSTLPSLSKGKGKLVAQDTLPWVEKYRPRTLGDLISHDDIISTSNCHCLYCQSLTHLATSQQVH